MLTMYEFKLPLNTVVCGRMPLPVRIEPMLNADGGVTTNVVPATAPAKRGGAAKAAIWPVTAEV